MLIFTNSSDSGKNHDLVVLGKRFDILHHCALRFDDDVFDELHDLESDWDESNDLVLVVELVDKDTDA